METIVSDKYQVVLPKNIRESLGILRGQKIRWISLSDSQAMVEPALKKKNHTQRLRGLGKGLWSTEDPQTYINKLRQEWTDWEKEKKII